MGCAQSSKFLSLCLMLLVSLTASFVAKQPKKAIPRVGASAFQDGTRFSTSSSSNMTNISDQQSLEECSSGQSHVVRWTTEAGTVQFEAYEGEILRTAALRRGVVSPHNGKSTLINCRGLGTCGTCAVEISASSAVEPTEKNARETLRLSFPPHNPSKQSPLLRLACQVQVRGDINVTKRSGFWGQYDSLSPSSKHETYFGPLEYLLDDKSPDSEQK